MARAVTESIDVGQQLTNTLIAELAPILELFGESITMQFLSESIGIADDVLFAMAPVGMRRKTFMRPSWKR